MAIAAQIKAEFGGGPVEGRDLVDFLISSDAPELANATLPVEVRTVRLKCIEPVYHWLGLGFRMQPGPAGYKIAL